MATIEQIRAARALLDWSQSDLADHADLSQTGIARIENRTNHPNARTMEKILTAFEKADIEFIGETGVKKRTGEIKVLKGTQGFRDFMDDVYEQAKTIGGEISLHSANPENWHKWMGKEDYEKHADRMKALGDKIKVRITCEEGNHNFVGSKFAEYRWFSGEMFKEKSFYAYGKKLAFLNFTDDDVYISVIDSSQFCEGFKVLFNIAWNYATKIPSE